MSPLTNLETQFTRINGGYLRGLDANVAWRKRFDPARFIGRLTKSDSTVVLIYDAIWQIFCIMEPITSPKANQTALLEFSAANARSYKDPVSISMEQSTSKGNFLLDVALPGGTVAHVNRVVGIFGANASGKTALLRVMGDMRMLVLTSHLRDKRDSPHSYSHSRSGISRRAFQLDPACRDKSSTYEVRLIVNGVKFDYGFEVNDEVVLQEWAHFYPKGRQALIFDRVGSEVKFGATDRKASRNLLSLMKPDVLLLSLSAIVDHAALTPLLTWFRENFVIASSHDSASRHQFSIHLLSHEEFRQEIVDLMRAADLGISNAEIVEPDPATKERYRRASQIMLSGSDESSGGDEEFDFGFQSIRLVHEGSEGPVGLDADDESFGTLAWFGLVGPLISVLSSGAVFLVDELDTSLHPLLVRRIVGLFQDADTNPNGAQLIFNSHDASLLGDSGANAPLTKDQVFLTEKGHDGSTYLYSLASTGVRRQESASKRYLQGRYGGVPIVSGADFAVVGRRATQDSEVHSAE